MVTERRWAFRTQRPEVLVPFCDGRLRRQGSARDSGGSGIDI